MEIKINLNQAAIYIPSGKMMNLKSQLRWDSIDFSPEEFKQKIFATYIQRYDTDFSFDKLQDHLIKQTILDYSDERKHHYKKLINNELADLKFFKEKNVVVDLPQVLNDAVSMVKSNLQVQEKIKKLQKLKLINS